MDWERCRTPPRTAVQGSIRRIQSDSSAFRALAVAARSLRRVSARIPLRESQPGKSAASDWLSLRQLPCKRGDLGLDFLKRPRLAMRFPTRWLLDLDDLKPVPRAELSKRTGASCLQMPLRLLPLLPHKQGVPTWTGRWKKLRNGRMNMHCALNHGVGRLCIHDIQQDVNHFIPASP